jgi:DHA1 family multidrug resistance protein-like MFS transporter
MSMPWLYSSRVFAGLFAAAMFPIAARAVASTLPEHQQRRGMAWLNASAALGVVAGPALGRLTDPLVDIGTTGLGGIDSKPYAFSFLILALFSMAVIPLAWWGTSEPGAREKGRAGASSVSWWQIGMSLRSVIAIVIASQLAMSLFMTAFALYADASLGYGPDGIGRVFALCGLLTAAVQVGIVWAIARHWDENKQIIWGSAAMAAGLLVIPLVPVGFGMTSAIAILVVGAAVIAPALLVVAAKVSPEHAGVAAGLVGSGTYLGQVLGPLLAGILFPWSDAAPFYASAGVMFAAAAMCLYSPLVPRVRLLKESVA